MRAELKKNVIFSYMTQVYTGLVGVFLVPFYIKMVGVESYALIGVLLMIQGLMFMLDIGLTPTIARETIKYNSSKISDVQYLGLYRLVVLFFKCTSLIVILIGVPFSYYYSDQYFTSSKLQGETITTCLILIFVIVALRWMSGFYKSVLMGYQKIVLLNFINILAVTGKNVVVFLSMYIWGSKIEVFFFNYMFFSCIENISLIIFTNRYMGKTKKIKLKQIDKNYVRTSLVFSTILAISSIIWVSATQIDKFLLLKYLDLNSFGYYTLIISACSFTILLSSPITTAVMPKLTSLFSTNALPVFLALFNRTTELFVLFMTLIVFIFQFYGEKILYFWLMDATIVTNIIIPFKFYLLGNYLLSVISLVYILQFARGILVYHLLGSVLFLVSFSMLLIYFIPKDGVLGAGKAWFIVNLGYLLVCVPLIFKKVMPENFINWYFKCLAFPFIYVLIWVYLFYYFNIFDGVFSLLFYISISSFFVLFSYKTIKGYLIKFIKQFHVISRLRN